MKELTAGCTIGLLYISLALAGAGGMATHLINTIKDEQYFLLTFGLLFPPVGVIHGWLIWLGIAS